MFSILQQRNAHVEQVEMRKRSVRDQHARGRASFLHCEMRIDCEREDASVCESVMQRERGDIFVVAERRSATVVDIIADARLRTTRTSSEGSAQREEKRKMRAAASPPSCKKNWPFSAA